MARIGKIGRLPRNIRTQLNTRLQDGAEGKQIVHWLNSLPEVKKILAEKFDGRPINEPNLTEWRQGGFEEDLIYQDLLAHAEQLAAHRHELQTAAQGQSLADHLATAISFRFAAILASQGPEFDEKSIGQFRILGRVCQAVVKLRRSDQNAARLKIENERWELERQQIVEDKAEAGKQKLRDTLATPVLAGIKNAERVQQFGGGPGARMMANYLQAVETCQDPANFSAAKILADPLLPEALRHTAELAKNPPVQRTAMQAAMDTLDEMDAYFERKEAKTKARSTPTQSQSPRPAKRPHQVHKVHAVHPVEPPPAPSNQGQSTPLSAKGPAPTEAGSATPPPDAVKEPVKAN